jgi:3-oxoadipate enol-lactonase
MRKSGDPTKDTRSMFELLTTREWFRAHPDVVDEYVAWRVAQPQPPAAYERQRATAGYSVEKRVAQIVAPTLIVHGAQDRIVPVKNAHLLAARIPNAKLVILPSAGHACMIDSAEEFNRAVVEFLT